MQLKLSKVSAEGGFMLKDNKNGTYTITDPAMSVTVPSSDNVYTKSEVNGLMDSAHDEIRKDVRLTINDVVNSIVSNNTIYEKVHEELEKSIANSTSSLQTQITNLTDTTAKRINGTQGTYGTKSSETDSTVVFDVPSIDINERGDISAVDKYNVSLSGITPEELSNILVVE